jgi:hypothetical protein
MWTEGKDIKHPNVQSGSKRSSPDLTLPGAIIGRFTIQQEHRTGIDQST